VGRVSLPARDLRLRGGRGAHLLPPSGPGSPFYYDRYVPFILLGPGIPVEDRDDRVSVVDLAPTAAEVLGIPYPDDLDGRPVLKRLEEG